MRKNKMLRMASALLMLVLLTTSVVGGTFAKYVTTSTATETARVAKWGVKITATGTTFSSSYANDEQMGATAIGKGKSVNGVADAKIVAPGTKGNLASTSITGTPEVAVRVEYTPTLTLSEWTVDGKEYCPLIFKVTKDSNTKTYGITGMKPSTGSLTNECADIAALKTAVEGAIKDFKADYEPNTDLSKVNNGVNVSWEWAFDGNDDSKDTALGNATTAATVKLEIVTTVTQID